MTSVGLRFPLYASVAVVGASLFIGSIGASAEIDRSLDDPPAGPRAAATIQDLMTALVDPSADAIWESVGIISTVDGDEERRPRNDEDWTALRVHAVRLVESADLLADTDRAVADVDTRSENPGIELEPGQTAWLIREQPAVWRGMAALLSKESRAMFDAVKRRDAQGIFDNGEALDQACEACHRHFWYPADADAVPTLSP